MLELNHGLLISVSLATIFIGLLLHRCLATAAERAFLWSFLGGVYIICGFGSAYTAVPPAYAVKYLIYILAASISFASVVGMLRPDGARLCCEIDRLLDQVGAARFAKVGFLIYLASIAFPLVYPTVHLSHLWSPPAPDLQAVFGHGIAPDKSIIERLLGYLSILFYPVYLWRLRALATRPVRLAVAVFGPLYITYCVDSYIGRGTMFMGLVLYTAFVWIYNRRARKYVVVALLALAPLALVGSALYARARLLNGLSDTISLSDEVQLLVQTETSLPLNAAVVMDSTRRVDLPSLTLWAVTLPIPKLLTGNIVTFEPNAEMAEIILNRSAGSDAFSFALPGIVGESIYFGGNYFYWFPAILIGGMFGVFCALGSKSDHLIGITAYCAFSWAYTFSRAGIDGGFPLMIDGLLPFLSAALFLSVTTPTVPAQTMLSTRILRQ